jgi:hypothetical protein
MRTLNTYSKPMIDRRINLALDDLELLRQRMSNCISIGESEAIGELLTNIEVALDLESDESDTWTFYNNGSRSHLNHKPLNNNEHGNI